MKHEVVYFNTDLICNNSVGQSESICNISFTRKLKNRRNDYYLLKEIIKNLASEDMDGPCLSFYLTFYINMCILAFLHTGILAYLHTWS